MPELIYGPRNRVGEGKAVGLGLKEGKTGRVEADGEGEGDIEIGETAEEGLTEGVGIGDAVGLGLKEGETGRVEADGEGEGDVETDEGILEMGCSEFVVEA